jgi:CelD/BcsL family acetyltransferase involved in cellulose biosynthesis
MTVVSPLPGTTVTAARSIEAVEGLRPVWERLQGHDLPSDIDYFLCVAEHNPEVLRPHVLLVEPPEGKPSILAAHVYETSIPHRLGPWTPYGPRLRALNVFKGVVGSPGEAELEIALDALREELDDGIDAILLRNLQVPSALHTVATRTFPRRSRQRWLLPRARWEADITMDPNGALEALSDSTRGNLRRTTRRLRRAFGDELQTRVYDGPGDAEVVFRDVDTVAVRTYQTQQRPVYRDDDLERALTRLGLEKGWFRAYVLYLGDRPVSFWTGFAYAGMFGWRGVTGYDPDFRSFGVGKYLLSEMLDHLARDPEIRRFSLGAGDLPYKRQFGDRGHEEIDIRAFASRPRPLAANYVGSGVQGLHALVRASASLPFVGRRVEARNEHLKRRRRRSSLYASDQRDRTSEPSPPPPTVSG